jgi:hypothetical protein
LFALNVIIAPPESDFRSRHAVSFACPPFKTDALLPAATLFCAVVVVVRAEPEQCGYRLSLVKE